MPTSSPTPTPAPVAAGPVRRPSAPVAAPPSTHLPRRPFEGDAGALAALARGELPRVFPAPDEDREVRDAQGWGRRRGRGPSDPVAPRGRLLSDGCDGRRRRLLSRRSRVLRELRLAQGRGQRVARVTRVRPRTTLANGSIRLAAMKVAEAEAAIHAGRDGIPVVPVVNDRGTQLERSDPFARVHRSIVTRCRAV